MVYNRVLRERSIFRKLPFGSPYWLSASTTVNPNMRNGRRTSIKGFGTTNAVADITAAVTRVPRVFLTPP